MFIGCDSRDPMAKFESIPRNNSELGDDKLFADKYVALKSKLNGYYIPVDENGDIMDVQIYVILNLYLKHLLINIHLNQTGLFG